MYQDRHISKLCATRSVRGKIAFHPFVWWWITEYCKYGDMDESGKARELAFKKGPREGHREPAGEGREDAGEPAS